MTWTDDMVRYLWDFHASTAAMYRQYGEYSTAASFDALSTKYENEITRRGLDGARTSGEV